MTKITHLAYGWGTVYMRSQALTHRINDRRVEPSRRR